MRSLARMVGVVAGLLAFGLTALAAEPEDWNQWRGPRRDGTVAPAAWPDALSESRLTRAWHVKLDPSYSGPIVAGDRVFTTATRGQKEEVVRAVDRATGETLWDVSWPGSMIVPFFAAANGSWIRSTPAWDGQRLYVGGMRDVLVCLDGATGDEVWRVDFMQKYGTALPSFGFVCSPLVTEDAVYVQAGAATFKLNKHTGAELWRTLEDKGGMNGSAFSSPVLTRLGRTEQLLVQTRQKLAGVDPQNGKVLWSQSIPAFQGMNILPPTVWNDRVFTSAYGGKSFLFDVQPGGDGAWKPSPAWSVPIEGYMSSPIVIGDHLYLHLRNQRFSCIDLQTGQETWRTRPYGKYWSMVACGDKVLALDQQGELLLIRANPERFELLDSRKVSDQETWAHLAVRGDEIFIRDLKGLAAWKWK